MKPLRSRYYWVTDMTHGISIWWDHPKQKWFFFQDGQEKIYINSIDTRAYDIHSKSGGYSDSVGVRGFHRACRMARGLIRILPENAEVVIVNKYEEYWLGKNDLQWLDKWSR